MPQYINVGGVLKELKKKSVNVGGVLKEIDNEKINEGGILKTIYEKPSSEVVLLGEGATTLWTTSTSGGGVIPLNTLSKLMGVGTLGQTDSVGVTAKSPTWVNLGIDISKYSKLTIATGVTTNINNGSANVNVDFVSGGNIYKQQVVSGSGNIGFSVETTFDISALNKGTQLQINSYCYSSQRTGTINMNLTLVKLHN